MSPIIAFTLLIIRFYISIADIRRSALPYEMLGKPNERSSHFIPMPRGGVLATVILVLAVSLWAANQVDINRSIIYIVWSAILARVGWRDDLFLHSPDYRFLVRGLVATISILELSKDPQRVKQMGENARAYLVKHFDRRDKSDKPLKLLTRLVHT